jgi:hypothetical protein
MSRIYRANTTTQSCLQLWLTVAPLIVLLIGISNNAAAKEEAKGSTRVSVMRQGTLAERDRGIIGASIEIEYTALDIIGKPPGEERLTTQPITLSTSVVSPNTDYWFYNADIELYFDYDEDGHYYGIDLWFDADTYFDAVDVYAVVYLSYESGPWNEFAATDNFTIFGASSDDDYVIETELMSGYPTGSYDILIELFDSFDGALLASIGSDDTAELALLPLEDSDRDAPVIVVQQFIAHGGGGSTGFLMLIMLAAVVIGVPRFSSNKIQ